MKRYLLLTILVPGVLLAISPEAFGASPYFGGTGTSIAAAVPRPTCADRLDNNLFACNVKSSFGSQFTDTLSFNQFPFFLFPAGLGFPLTCSCEATGAFANPNFNGSLDRWICVGDNGFGFSMTFKGQVLGTGKLRFVLATSNFGDQFVFDCAGP